MTDETADELLKTISSLRQEIEELRAENRRLREKHQAPNPPPDDEIIQGFFETKNYAESTKRPYRLCLGYFRKHLDDKSLPEATTDDALKFANNWGTKDGGVAKNTMVTYLTRVKKLYDYICEHQWGPAENPIEPAIQQFRSENSSYIRRSGQNKGTVLSPHEYQTFVARNNRPREGALLILAAKTGLRRKELVNLRVEDVDLSRKKIYNCSPKGVGNDRLPKNSADEKLIDDETVDALDRWLQTRERIINRLGTEDSGWLFINRSGDQASPMSVSRWWKKASERAANGVDDDHLAEKYRSLTPHDARRCFTSWLNWNGCPRDVISVLRGDADGDMVALYTQYDEGEVREKYEAAIPSIAV